MNPEPEKPISTYSIEFNDAPGDYQMNEPLRRAVELAYFLNKPLLVGGDPGTGKTQLARKVAVQLHQQTQGTAVPFLPEPLRFNTKSSSAAADLFYYYDAVSHFRNQQGLPIAHFTELKALGLAFVLSKGLKKADLPAELARKVADRYTNGNLEDAQARSSVVLIDEVDKAPREFPNDLLNEVEQYTYEIRELGCSLEKSKQAKVLIILTSNFEKNLPPAFLRRCVYYHIPFPKTDQLLTIIQKRLLTKEPLTDTKRKKLSDAIDTFMKLREESRNTRTPSTAELLDWLGYMMQMQAPGEQVRLFDAITQFPPRPGDPFYGEYQLITESLVLKSNRQSSE